MDRGVLQPRLACGVLIIFKWVFIEAYKLIVVKIDHVQTIY